jgi:hypothetical protein
MLFWNFDVVLCSVAFIGGIENGALEVPLRQSLCRPDTYKLSGRIEALMSADVRIFRTFLLIWIFLDIFYYIRTSGQKHLEYVRTGRTGESISEKLLLFDGFRNFHDHGEIVSVISGPNGTSFVICAFF